MATLEQLLSEARKQSDSYLGQQKAVAQTDYDGQVNALRKALEQSQTEANLQQGSVKRDYDTQVGEINQQVYNDSQIRQLMGYAGGMQNSQQFLAQMAGDQYRRQQLDAGVAKDRDSRLHEIATRINSLKSQTDFDLAGALSGFNNRVAGLTSEAENMYSTRVSSIREQQLQQQYQLEQMQKQYELDLAMMNAQLKASGGAGGGGGGSTGGTSRASTSNTKATTSSLTKAIAGYNTAKKATPLSIYKGAQPGASVLKQGMLANPTNSKSSLAVPLIKAPAKDKNLTSLQVVNMMTNKSPKLTAKASIKSANKKKTVSGGKSQMR